MTAISPLEALTVFTAVISIAMVLAGWKAYD